jgi:hypothetical protein
MEMLTGFCEAIADEMAAGKTLDEVLAADATAELDARYGDVFFTRELFTGMVYRSLGGALGDQ